MVREVHWRALIRTAVTCWNVSRKSWGRCMLCRVRRVVTVRADLVQRLSRPRVLPAKRGLVLLGLGWGSGDGYWSPPILLSVSAYA